MVIINTTHNLVLDYGYIYAEDLRASEGSKFHAASRVFAPLYRRAISIMNFRDTKSE